MRCNNCNGKGRIVEVSIDEDGHEVITGFPACPDCGGSGEEE